MCFSAAEKAFSIFIPMQKQLGAVSKLIAAFYLMAYNKCSPELCLFKYYSLSLFLSPVLQLKSAKGKTSTVITINYCSTFPKQSKFMLWISYSVTVNPIQLTVKECLCMCLLLSRLARNHIV